MTEYTIHPLVVGANATDQGIMTYLKGYGKRIWIPIYVFYLEGGPEKILVDTGLEQSVVPPAVGTEYSLKIQEFEDALATFNLTPADIDVVLHTHLHNDHCENHYKCTNARVYVQKREYAFFTNLHPADHRYFPDLLGDNEVVLLDGDQVVTDGVSVLLTPGHTVSGQSIVVNTKKAGPSSPVSAATTRTLRPPGPPRRPPQPPGRLRQRQNGQRDRRYPPPPPRPQPRPPPQYSGIMSARAR
jgi:N-acyl homoserine lactone hydrolase